MLGTAVLVYIERMRSLQAKIKKGLLFKKKWELRSPTEIDHGAHVTAILWILEVAMVNRKKYGETSEEGTTTEKQGEGTYHDIFRRVNVDPL